MTDDAPHTPRTGLPPVRMALRVKGRHGHKGGPHLARAVVAARAPKHLAAATRLAHPGAEHAAETPPPAPAPYTPAAPVYEPPAAPEAAVAREPAAPAVPAGPEVAGLSDFALEYMFGDSGLGLRGARPHVEGGQHARAEQGGQARPPPGARRAGRLARGADPRGPRRGTLRGRRGRHGGRRGGRADARRRGAGGRARRGSGGRVRFGGGHISGDHSPGDLLRGDPL